MCQRDSGLQFLPGVGQGRPSMLSESSPRENMHMFRELPRLISDLERILTALIEISVLTSSSPVSQSLMREIAAEILAASGSSSQGFTKAWPRHLTLSGCTRGSGPPPLMGPPATPWLSAGLASSMPSWCPQGSTMDLSTPGTLNLGMINLWDQGILCCGVCPVFCRALSRVRGQQHSLPQHSDGRDSVSRSVVSDSLEPHGLQPTRPLCP